MQRRIVKARTDTPGVRKALVGHVADQQRSQPHPGALRCGEPADDQLLTSDALQLQPVGRPSTRPIAGVGPLGDQALPAAVACVGQQSPTRAAVVTVEVFAEAQRIVEVERFAQQLRAVA